MPSYNRGHLLHWALLSLINQKERADEIVIVDDGSEDGTKSIVERIQESYPEANIRYYFNNNPGWTICCHALNCAIKKASSEILMLTEPEVLHASEDVKIIKRHFENPANDKTILIGNPLYRVYEEAFQKLTEEELLDPILITRRKNVHEWYQGYCSPPDTITFMPRGGTHHIAAILKKHMINIQGYEESFEGAGGYDDIEMLTRLRYYGVKEVRTNEIIAIHLYHAPPPSYVQKPELVRKNYEKMQLKVKLLDEKLQEGELKDEWKANQGKEWGILKK